MTTTSHNLTIGIVVVVGIVIGNLIRTRIRNGMQPIWRDTLKCWAQKNDCQLLEIEYHAQDKGPFSWTTVRSQGVYRIAVTDKNGNERQAWARVSNWQTQDPTSNVEIRWDN